MIDTDRILMLLGDIKESMGELKADARNAETSRKEMKKLLEDHVSVDLAVASRVSSLERSRAQLRGMVIATSAGISIAVAIATFAVKNLAWAAH